MSQAFRVVFLLIATFFSTELLPQTVKGVIRDIITKEHLPYVNISVEGTMFGTISKDDGSFVLNLSERPEHSDTVVFSMIGYQSRRLAIAGLKDSIAVEMEPTAVHLEAVFVSPRTPSELIKLAIGHIPRNYVREPFNATIYFRTMVKLNGRYVELTEALIQGYLMPVTGYDKDTTRLKLIALKYFDEQELAMQSVVSKKRKRKGDKLAIEGMDTMMISMSRNLNEHFGIYKQIDSNLIKQLYENGYEEDRVKYTYGPLLQYKGRNLLKLQFKGSVKGLAQHSGNLLLDEETLAFEAFNYKLESSSLRLKLLFMLAGIGFKNFDMVLGFRSIPTEQGWIPESLTTNAFIDMEKNKWFAKDIPLVMELSSELRFLDIAFPATDECRNGKLIGKKTALKEQFSPDPDHSAWEKYDSKIKAR